MSDRNMNVWEFLDANMSMLFVICLAMIFYLPTTLSNCSRSSWEVRKEYLETISNWNKNDSR